MAHKKVTEFRSKENLQPKIDFTKSDFWRLEEVGQFFWALYERLDAARSAEDLQMALILKPAAGQLADFCEEIERRFRKSTFDAGEEGGAL